MYYRFIVFSINISSSISIKFAFVKITKLSIYIETIKKYLEKDEIVYGDFIYFEKALDTVNHEILLRN